MSSRRAGDPDVLSAAMYRVWLALDGSTIASMSTRLGYKDTDSVRIFVNELAQRGLCRREGDNARTATWHQVGVAVSAKAERAEARCRCCSKIFTRAHRHNYICAECVERDGPPQTEGAAPAVRRPPVLRPASVPGRRRHDWSKGSWTGPRTMVED